MIGILTFYWADDYGGMLQAYALKRQLELLGERAEFIPYAPFKLTGRYWLCPLWAEPRGEGLHYYFQRYMFARNLSMGKSFWKRRLRMRAFRRRHLTTSLPVRSATKISLLNYESVLIGSDQVWNPEITVDLDDAYIGNIPQRGGCRLISYGASLGGNPLSEADRRKFVQYAGTSFSALSVRERADAVFVEGLLHRKVCDVLDPVLLLERSEWEQIGISSSRRDYILLYMTQFNGPLLQCAQELAVRYGKKIVSLSNLAALADRPEGVAPPPDIEIWLEGGPAEFLGYIQNAFCVLTNSFHGTAFSILLEKPFLSFRHSTRSVRQSDLLGKVGLLSHLVETDTPFDPMEIGEQTDWESVRARLAAEQTRSREFILNHI